MEQGWLWQGSSWDMAKQLASGARARGSTPPSLGHDMHCPWQWVLRRLRGNRLAWPWPGQAPFFPNRQFSGGGQTAWHLRLPSRRLTRLPSSCLPPVSGGRRAHCCCQKQEQASPPRQFRNIPSPFPFLPLSITSHGISLSIHASCNLPFPYLGERTRQAPGEKENRQWGQWNSVPPCCFPGEAGGCFFFFPPTSYLLISSPPYLFSLSSYLGVCVMLALAAWQQLLLISCNV